MNSLFDEKPKQQERSTSQWQDDEKLSKCIRCGSGAHIVKLNNGSYGAFCNSFPTFHNVGFFKSEEQVIREWNMINGGELYES